MIRQVSVFTLSNFPSVDMASRIESFACPDLSPHALEVAGWEPWSDNEWLIEHQDLVVVKMIKRFRRIPKSLLDEHIKIETLGFDAPMTALEKRQLKTRVSEKLLPQMMPEKTDTMVMIDKRHNTLAIASQSAAVTEKILKVFQDTFPGVSVARRWSKDAVRQACRVAWKKDTWPQGMKPDGDLVLVHMSDQYKKIRFSGLSDLTVADDCLLHGYMIIGVRLTHSEGLSCYVTPLGNFQGLRYPSNEDAVILEHDFDWLPILELRAWIETFGSWVHEH